MKLAIFSPRQAAQTESFIAAHRQIPGAEVLFYYGGVERAALEGRGTLLDTSLRARIRQKLEHTTRSFSAAERAVMRSLRHERPQVVLAEYGTTGARLLPLVKALQLPLVVHFHGFDASMQEVLQVHGQRYREMFAYCTAVIAVSQVMVEQLRLLGCPTEKIVYNPYGPDPAFQAVQSDQDDLSLLGMGRFVDKKAPYFTLLAFKQVLTTYPEARLVMGGEGVLLESCQNLATYFGLTRQVSFSGLMSRDQYIEGLRHCRAFVQHSITPRSGDMEGTPLAVLEAQAAGVPVVATSHAGIADVVVHGHSGLLCHEHDVDGMAMHMRTLLGDHGLAQRLGRAARTRIVEHFSQQRHLQCLAETLHSAIGKMHT